MKGMVKAVAAITLIIASLFCGCVPAAAEEAFPDALAEPSLKLRVDLFDDAQAYTYVHELPGYPDAPYVLFLPADCDRTRLRVSFDARQLKVGDAVLRSGDATDVFAADGNFTVEADGVIYPLRVLSSANLPSIYISTESGSLAAIHADKEHREAGALTVAENGAVTLAGSALSYIKGRGNSSWKSNEKRSYSIKFSEKTGLLGMSAAKKWALVSDNMDKSLMRNAIAYSAAKRTDLPFTVDFRFADLYINGGYRGNYLICEKVEVGSNRVDIADLDDANEQANPGVDLASIPVVKETQGDLKLSWSELPAEPQDISGGYLLEYDYPEEFDLRPAAFQTANGTTLVLHAPEYAGKGEISYVAALYAAFEEALLSPDGVNAQGKHYTEYIDIPSFVDGILIYDFTSDQDRGHSSWYIYLPAGEQRFHMGPMWDFDQSMDNAEHALFCVETAAKTRYDASKHVKKLQRETFIEQLCSHEDFIDAMADRFPALADAFESDLNGEIAALFARIASSASADAIRWGYDPGLYQDTQLRDYIPARCAKLRADFANIDALIEQALQAIEAQGGYASGASAQTPLRIVLGVAAVVAAGVGIFLVIRAARRRKTE